MKIGIIGAGRLGLTFALLCEKNGYEVLVSDVRKDYVDNLNKKICHTNEPQIEHLLSLSKNFTATTNNIEVIEECDLIFTFVATPSTFEGNYDTSSLYEIIKDFKTSESIGVEVSNKKFVVGCTTNPGDVDDIQKKLSDLQIKVAYNPEFIAQGEIVKGIEQSDIVLIGTDHQELADELINIYNQIQTTKVNAQVMSNKAAEITKIGVNCFLTTKISYANMIGQIMTLAGVESEISTVLNAIGNDTRVGKKYLNYGFGFGGPCLPRDNRALGHFANKFGMNLNIPLTVDSFNNEHAKFIKNYYIQKNPDKSVPFIMNYVTYKKGTDILEESQQFQLCLDLLDEGYSVFVIEIQEVIEKLIYLTESYNGRIKFYLPGEHLEGYEITL
jgi:UDPglucose 6-dehydrogenase